MKGLLDLFKQFTPDEHFDAIKIGIASPELQERICLEDASPISIASKLLISIT